MSFHRLILVMSLICLLTVSCGGGSSSSSTTATDDTIVVDEGITAEALISADDGTTGWELAKIEGGQLSIIKDINTGANGSYPRRFTLYNNKVYFAANDGTDGSTFTGELWVTDTTEAGTYKLKDINTVADSGSRPTEFTVFGGKLYFIAETASGDRELWVTDGTEAGTVNKVDMYTGTEGGFSNLHVYNGMLYHLAIDLNTMEKRIWKTDGTTATVLLDNNAGADYITAGLDSNVNFTELNGVLYFIADDAVGSYDIWETDGTQPGTGRVVDLPEESGELVTVARMAAVGSNLLLFASTNTGTTYKAWASTGAVGDKQAIWGNPLFEVAPSAAPIFVHNGAAYFSGKDGTQGYEPWRWDGVIGSPPALMADLNFPGDSRPNMFNAHGGKVFFTADETSNGRSLFKYDDVTEALLQVTTAAVHPDLSMPLLFENGLWNDIYIELNTPSALYFSGYTTLEGFELWLSDGTPSGTGMVVDFNPGTGHGMPGVP